MKNEYVFSTVNEAYDFLRGLIKLLNQLLAIIEKGINLSPQQNQQARELYTKFKTTLREYYDFKKTNKIKNSMIAGEAHYVFPAIQETLAPLTIPINSYPSQKWLNELVDARFTLGYYIDQIE